MKEILFIFDGDWRKCLQLIELKKEVLSSFNINIITNDRNISLLKTFSMDTNNIFSFTNYKTNLNFELAINFSFTDIAANCMGSVKATSKIGAGDDNSVSTIWSKVLYLSDQNKIPFPFIFSDICRNIIGIKKEFKVTKKEAPTTLIVNLAITNNDTKFIFLAEAFEYYNNNNSLKELILIDSSNADLPLKTLKKVSYYKQFPINLLTQIKSNAGIFIGFSDTLTDLLPTDHWSFVFFENNNSLLSPKAGAYVKFQPYILNQTDVKDCFDIVKNINNEEYIPATKWYVLSDEYLTNKRLKLINPLLANTDDIFDQFYFILWNFVFSLKDVSLTPVQVTSEQSKHLESTSSVAQKLVQLNNFALTELNAIIKHLNDKNNINLEYQEKINKLGEIDDLSIKLTNNFSHLAPLVYYYHLCKVKAQGQDLISIAKELVLIYYEMNQSLLIINELIAQTIKQEAKDHSLRK